jgi:hypothetical protein
MLRHAEVMRPRFSDFEARARTGNCAAWLDSAADASQMRMCGGTVTVMWFMFALI